MENMHTVIQLMNQQMETSKELIAKIQKNIDVLEGSLGQMDKDMVGKDLFKWVIGILITTLIAMFSYISFQISEMRRENVESFRSVNVDIVNIKEDVATLKGKITNP